MKKVLAILLALSLTAALAACGKQDESSDKSDAATTTTAAANQQESSGEDQTTTTTTTAATDSTQDSKVSDESSDVGEVLGPLEPGKLFVFPLEDGGYRCRKRSEMLGVQA